MKISLKTISGQIYQVDAENNQTIDQLKAILHDNFGFEEPFSLLYQSKRLNGLQTIESINYTDQTFIVIFKRKIPNQVSSKPSQSDISTKKSEPFTEKTLPDITKTPKRNSSETINTEFKTTLHSSPLKNLILSAQTKFGDPPDFNEKVESLKVLGFDQCQIESALRAALYRVELAADYLTSGNIPDIPQQLNLDDESDLQIDNQDEEEEVDELTQYRKDLSYLKKVFQKDPAHFAYYVSELEKNGLEIARTIRNDPSLFLYQLGLDPSKYDIESVRKPTSKYEELMSAFNQEERSAIHRIESAGFDTMTVIQVFTACDKNEELATSCLISMK